MKTTILGISFEIVDYDANYEVVGTSDNYSFTNNLGRGRDLLGIGELGSEDAGPAEYHANIDLLGNYGSFDVRVYAVSDLGIRSEFIQSNINIAAPSFDGTFMFSNIQLIKNGKAKDGEIIKTPTKIDNEFITSSKFTGRSIHLSWSLVPPPGHPREGESVSTDLLKDSFFNRFEISIKNGKDKIILNDQQLNASAAMQELLSSANVSGSLKNYRDFTLEIFGSAFNDLDLERNVSIEIKCFDSNGSESIGIIHLENPKPVLSNFLKSHKQLGTYFSWDCRDEDYENLVVRYIAIPGGQELTDDSDLIESAEYLGQMRRAQNYININNKIYRVGEKVLFGGVIYECIQEHTTSDLTTPEVGGNSYWDEVGPKYPCLYRTVGEQLNSFDIVQVFGYNYFYAFQPFDEYGPGDIYNLTNEGLQIQSDNAKLKGFGHDLYIGSTQVKERKDDLIFSWNILDHQFNKVDLNKYKNSVEEYGMPLVLGISGSLFDADTNQQLMRLNESRNQGVDVSLTEQNPIEIGGLPDYEIYDRYEYTREVNNSIYGTGGFPQGNEFDYNKIYSPDTNDNYVTIGDLLLFKSKIQNSVTNVSGPSIQNSPPYIRPYYAYWNSNLTYLFGAGGDYDCHILIYDNRLYKLKRDFGPESQDVKEFFNEENNYQQGEIVVAPTQSVKVFNSSSAYLPSDLALFRGRLYVCKAEQTAGNAVSPELGVAFWEERSLNSSIGFGLFKAKSSIASPISIAPFKNDTWEFLTPNVAVDYFELYVDSYYLKGSNEYNTNYVPNIDEWNNSVKYVEGLFVLHKNNIWLAKKNSGPSTSRGSVEPGEDSDYWVDSLDVGGSNIDFFTDHNQGDLVFYHNAVFKCLANNPTGAPLEPLTSLRQASSSNYEDSQWKPFWEVDDSYDSVVFGHVGIPESGKRDVGLEVGIVGLDGTIISSQKIIGTNPPPDILRQGFTASSTTKASRVRFNFNYKEGFAEKTTKVNLYRSSTPEFDITGSNKFAASSAEEFLDTPTNSIPNPNYNASFVKTTIGEGEHADFGDNITEIFDDPPLFVDSDGIEHPTGYYYKILPFDDFGSGNLYGVKDNMHDLEKVIVYPKSYHSPDPHAPIGEIPRANQPGVPAGDTTTVILEESIPGPVANFTGVTAFENYFLNWDLPNSEILKEQNGNKLVAVQPNDIDHFEVWESNESHLEVDNTELTKDQNLRGYRRILGDLPSFGDVPTEELDIGYDITNATEIMEIAGDGFSFEAIHQGATNERRYFWIRAVDAAGNKSPFTGAANLATDTVEGLELTLGQAKTTDIADFEQNITATFPNTLALIPNNPFENNFSLASNSTKNGTVSWEEHFVYYNGEGYLIKEGETDDAYVYWSATGQTPTHNFTVRDITSSELAALGLGVEGGGVLDASKGNPLRNLKYVAEYDTSDYHPAGAGHSTELNSSDPDAPYNNNEFPNLLGETDDFIIARNANGIATTMWHSFANATIGTAHIEEAAITSAKVHTLTADKIRSAEIKGQDIQVGGTGQIRSFNFPGLVNPIEDQPSGFAISGDGTFIFAGDEGRLHFDDGELVLEGKLRTKKGKEYTFIDLDASPDSFFYNELSDGTYTPDGDQTCNIRATFQNSFIESNEVRFKIESPDGTEFVSYDDVDPSDGSYNENGFTYNPSNPLNKFDGIEEPRVANAQLTVGGFNSMINTVDPQLTTIIVSASGVNTSTERSIPINFVADGAAAVYAELKAQQQVYSYDYDGKFNDTNLNLNLEATAHNTHGNIEFLFETGVNLEASSLKEILKVTKDTNTTNTASAIVAQFGNTANKALYYYDKTPFVAKLTISDEDGELASDFVSIFGTLPGKDSYTVFLTNENHTYPAQENGSVTSSQDYVLGQTKIKFFRGNTEYTHDKDGLNTNVGTYRIDSNLDVSPATVSASIVDDTVDDPIIRITDLPKNVDEGTITISIYDNQYYGTTEQEVFSKVYTFSKTKEGAKGRQLELTATDQTIEYNSQGSRIGPDSVTITANTENFFHATPQFEFYSGDFTNTIQSQGVGNTYTHDDIPASYDSDHIPVTILCKAFDSLDGTTFEEKARDQITIFGIKEGANAITFVQSQEFANVPVANSSSGDVDTPDFSSTTNEIKVFEGIKELTYDGTSDGTTKSNFYVTDVSVKDASNDAVITSEVTKTGPTSASPSTTINGWTDLTITNVYLEYSIKVVNHEGLAETFLIRQNVTLTFDGTIARKVDLTADQQSVTYDTAGSSILSPSTNNGRIKLTATDKNTGSTVKFKFAEEGSFSGQLKLEDGTAYDSSKWSDGNEVYYHPPSSRSSFNSDTIKVEISENENNVLASDVLTIYAIQDGSDVITAILSNEAHSLTKDFEGTITSTGSGTDIKVFQGAEELTFVTGPGNPSGENTFTVAIAGSLPTGVTGGSRTTPSNKKHCNVAEYNFSSFTGQSATITYTITFKNDVGETGTITKQQTFSISAQGIQGNRGVGITFRGVYDPTEEEYIGAVDGGNRGDVVEYDGSYYLCIQDNGTKSTLQQRDPTDDLYWEGFGAEFSSVATDILLAKDAAITHSLVMGTATDLNGGSHNPKVGASTSNGSGGIIRSANKTGFGDGNEGFFLGDTGVVEFEVGDSDSFIKFDTDSDRVEIKGSLIINSRDYTDLNINSTVGEDATFIGGGYNNFITGSQVGQNGLASSIVGGGENDVSGRFSFIGGGFDNNLGDNFSAIVAGYNNEMPNLETGNAGANFIGAGVLNVIDGGSSQSVCNGKFNEIIYSPELYLGEIVPEDQTNVVFNDNMDLLGDKYFAFDPKDGVYPIEDFIIGDASLASAVPNVKLMTLAYRSLLYREPDSAGMNSYLGFSDMGSVISNIKTASEYSTRQNNLPAPKLQMILANSSKGLTDPLCIIGSRIAEKFHVPRDFLSGTRNIALGSWGILENPFYTKDPDLSCFFVSNSKYYDSSSEFGYWVYALTTDISGWAYISASYSSEGIWIYKESYGWIFIWNSETINLSYGAYQRFDNGTNYKLSDGSVIP